MIDKAKEMEEIEAVRKEIVKLEKLLEECKPDLISIRKYRTVKEFVRLLKFKHDGKVMALDNADRVSHKSSDC